MSDAGFHAFRRATQWLLTRWRCLLLLGVLWLSGGLAATAQAHQAAEPSATLMGVLSIVHADDLDHRKSRFFYFLKEYQSGEMLRLRFQDEPVNDDDDDDDEVNPQTTREAVPHAHKSTSRKRHPAFQVPAHLRSGSLVTVRGSRKGKEITVRAEDVDDDSTSGIRTMVAGAATAVSGEQKTLVIVANMQNSAVSCSVDTIRNMLFAEGTTSVNELYQENSFGQIWLTGAVQGVTLARRTTDACDYNAMGSAAEAAAQSAGVNVSSYNRRVYVFPSNTSCPYIGLGTIGGTPSRSWIFRCTLPDLFAHEYGHNLTAHHAGTATNEYADTSDIMGYSGVGLRHFNAPHKDQMGWLSPNQIVTATESGTYDLAPLAAQPGALTTPQVLKIAKPDSNEYYYFSYRRKIGLDTSLAATYLDRVNVHRYKGNGALLTYFLKGLNDGESFTDSANQITVTQVSHNTQTARVQVSLACAPQAPVVRLTPATQKGTPGAQLSYTVTLTNQDAPGCGSGQFNLSAVLPSGWSGSVQPPSLSLQPDEVGVAVLSVTSPGTAPTGQYALQMQVSNPTVTVHSGKAQAIYSIELEDTVPPTAPSLRAYLTIKNNIRLAKLLWYPSTDNKGVVAYSVWRNGLRVGTISAQSSLYYYTYMDTGLAVNQSYTYYVIAHDAAGNASIPSNGIRLGSSGAQLEVLR